MNKSAGDLSAGHHGLDRDHAAACADHGTHRRRVRADGRRRRAGAGKL